MTRFKSWNPQAVLALKRFFRKWLNVNSVKQSYVISRFVFLLSLLMAVSLGAAVWDINPWPTDAEVYYMPAAFRVPHIHYLSEIHVTEGMERVRWLHGKEFYVAAISLFQFMLNDFESLRPLMLIGLIAIAVSSILIFYIARRLWGDWIALACYFAFALSLWPYIYILFAKHQTLGLMFFLLAVVCLLNCAKSRFRSLWFLLSGLMLGLAFFSSTVTSLYLPYYAAGFWGVLFLAKDRPLAVLLRRFIVDGLWVVAGFAAIFIYVNLPDIVLNVKNYIQYVHISGAFNHFYYNQVALQQWFPNMNVGEVRAGWVWIFKYLFLILPVVFPVYLFAAVYLMWRIVKQNNRLFRMKTLGILLLSVSSPIMAESVKVAQYGANYFPTIVGIIILVAYAVNDFIKCAGPDNVRVKNRIAVVFAGLVFLQAATNLYLFVTDVYVPRMATTFLSDKIRSLGVDRLATYRVHFHRNHFVFCLNSKLRQNIKWIGVKSLGQLEEGYMIVPPATGDSLYVASSTTYNNFDEDSVLVWLLRNDLLKGCAVASFRTLANSRIWQQEEEILSYRSLILNQRFPEDILGRVWLLDGQKVKTAVQKMSFSPEDRLLLAGNVNNIGTSEKFYMFEGQRVMIHKPTLMRVLLVNAWKKGLPEDSLIASVYHSDPDEPIWLPVAKNFTSQVLPAGQVPRYPDGGVAVFHFDPPLKLERGVYNFVIYRTGKPDDQNYYQIDNRRFAVQ